MPGQYGTPSASTPYYGIRGALCRRCFLDLKFTFRQLRKSPGFTVTAVLMLAFGIGATTAIFSIVEGVLLRPLPFPDSDRLVELTDRLQGADVGGNGEVGVTVPDIRAYTRDTHSFAALGGYQFAGYELSGAVEPAQVSASRLTAGVFSSSRNSTAAWPSIHRRGRRTQPAGCGSELWDMAGPLPWR